MHKLLLVYFFILLHTQSFNIKNIKSGYLLDTKLYSKKNKNTTPKYDYVYINDYEELDVVIENKIKALNLKKNLVLSNANEYINENDIYKYMENNIDNYEKKKLIILSPGGINGFYMLGVCNYIKDNYNLTNYIFSGAIDFIHDFFQFDNNSGNLYTKKIFNFLETNNLFKKYTKKFADKGIF